MEYKNKNNLKKDRDKEEHYKYNLRNVYCVNCGEKGHVLKECNGPITSFGIIAFKTCKEESDCINDTNNKLKEILKKINTDKEEYPKIKFLMIQRKDTMGYIDFIRGKYDIRPGYEKERFKKIQEF
jgi:hypothetical protein